MYLTLLIPVELPLPTILALTFANQRFSCPVPILRFHSSYTLSTAGSSFFTPFPRSCARNGVTHIGDQWHRAGSAMNLCDHEMARACCSACSCAAYNGCCPVTPQQCYRIQAACMAGYSVGHTSTSCGHMFASLSPSIVPSLHRSQDR